MQAKTRILLDPVSNCNSFLFARCASGQLLSLYLLNTDPEQYSLSLEMGTMNSNANPNHKPTDESTNVEKDFVDNEGIYCEDVEHRLFFNPFETVPASVSRCFARQALSDLYICFGPIYTLFRLHFCI